MAIFSLKKIISVLAMGGLYILFLSISTYAMQSQQYDLEPQEITNEVINPSEPQATQISLPSDQLTELKKNGFFVTNDTPSSFIFSTKAADLSFGVLTPSTESEVSNSITIASGAGYQVMISALRPLTSLSGSTLNNTTCDKKCTYLHAAPWVNDSNYGLGYTLIGQNKAEDFLNSRYFRALPDLSQKQLPTTISKTTSTTANNSLEIRFKLIPSTNDNESYSAVINLDAIPTY